VRERVDLTLSPHSVACVLLGGHHNAHTHRVTGLRTRTFTLVVALIFLGGWGLAFVRAPASVVDDPCRKGG